MTLSQTIQETMWAIQPAKLDEILALISSRIIEGNPADEDLEERMQALRAESLGSSKGQSDRTYEVMDGVAVIPITGTLMKRANLFSLWSGGTSYQLIKRDVDAAAADPAVRSILLVIDSPGGTVDGVMEASDAILSARAVKPVVAFADGMATSAAQLLASSASTVVVERTSMMGSIGVYSVHYDLSERDAKAGVKRTEIVAGRYKAVGSDAKALSEGDLAYLQERIDYSYSLFLTAMASAKGMGVEQILGMADGRMFTGQQAVDIGLADRVGDRASAMRLAMEMAGTRQRGRRMTAEELKEKHLDTYNAVFQSGAKSVDVDGARAEAAKRATETATAQERERVVRIMESGADHPAVALQAVKDGTSSDAAGWLLLDAEKAAKASALKEYQEGGAESAGHAAKEKSKPDVDPKAAYLAKVDEYQKAGLSRTQALSKIASEHPDVHRAYIEACRKTA